MAKISWDQAGSRFYENGVDRGVLYANGGPGVPWNGLASMHKAPTGAAPKPYYIDGYKFQNRATREEFGGIIEAFTYPDEFEQCDGELEVGSGLSVAQQRRVSFGMCYRTRIGNDVDGTNHGYKLHLIYNAIVTPTTKHHASITDNPDAILFTWTLTTKAIITAGYRPINHMIIDSTEVAAPLLASLENILYGSDSANPRLPLPVEIISMFSSAPTLYITNNGDGTFTATGPDNVVSIISAATFQIISSTAVDNGNGSFTVSPL